MWNNSSRHSHHGRLMLLRTHLSGRWRSDRQQPLQLAAGFDIHHLLSRNQCTVKRKGRSLLEVENSHNNTIIRLAPWELHRLSSWRCEVSRWNTEYSFRHRRKIFQAQRTKIFIDVTFQNFKIYLCHETIFNNRKKSFETFLVIKWLVSRRR